MPVSKLHGTESAANKAIGGVPEMLYFDFGSKGRAQVIRLLWEDAGIAYKDTRFSFEEYPDFAKGPLLDLNPLGKIPVVLINGRALTQSYAILRHFARQLGAYDGKTEDEKYWTDALADLAADWRTRFVDAFLSEDKEEYAKYGREVRPIFLKGVEGNLSSNSLSLAGPFVLGNEITYADLIIYQVSHDDGLTKNGRAGLQGYPRLTKLVDALEDRPNVKAFLNSDRYLG